MYAWWAAARHVSEQLLNAMWKVERVVSSTLVMAGRCQEISAPECCHAAIARWTATIRSTPSLTVRRQFGWECRALGSGLWTAFGEGFDGALPCFGALSEAVRRGEDGGGFGMESGGGWSDAERARQALIQVDRNDPINTPSLTVRRQFGWECRALGSGLWTAFGEGFDGALPCFGALSEAVRRGEDGGGFGMGSGGGWSDAERARQALIQVDRNDPINTPSLTVRRQFGWECRALGSGLWTAFGEGFDGALPCFGALSEAVRRGEDGGGFGMGSGGGWSDAERARQALIQVDRNDPINTPSLTVRRQFGWECRALGSGLWTAFGQGFDGALPCFGALSEAIRRGEDGGGFGMGSGGGWSDAERARQALIQVDRNDPINHIPYREKAIRMGVSCSRKRSRDGFRGRLRWRVALLRCSVGSRRWKEFFRVPSGMRVADLW